MAILSAVLAFFSGLFLSVMVSGAVEAGVKSIFVLFAQDPEAMAANHPVEFAEFFRNFYGVHPALIESAGYGRFSPGGGSMSGAGAPRSGGGTTHAPYYDQPGEIPSAQKGGRSAYAPAAAPAGLGAPSTY